MRIALFYHSLRSDWNHGNAHFLRGIARDLLRRGHAVDIYEPADGWSLSNLVEQHGPQAAERFHDAYPDLESILYDHSSLHYDDIAGRYDLIIIHEWNDPALVKNIGQAVAHCADPSSRPWLFFHETHHRSVTNPAQIHDYDLSHYDGVLAFGKVIRDRYLRQEWARRAWVWHEAADITVFHPRQTEPEADVVWIGNWGDDERTEELREYLMEPVARLGLKATVYGVRYPEAALKQLDDHGIRYAGYLPNHRVPEVFAQHRIALHIPRRPYVQHLPGIPTIRPFEAMACGIPLISAPWSDSEKLFNIGRDSLMVRSGDEMTAAIDDLIKHPRRRRELAAHGLTTITDRHTCSHRIDELIAICRECGSDRRDPQSPSQSTRTITSV